MQFRLGLVLSLSWPSLVLASETRLETLRESGGIDDPVRVFTYPALVTDYSLALIELGTADDKEAYGGVMKSYGANSFGVFLSRDESLMTAVSLSDLSLVDTWIRRASSNNDVNAILPMPERPIDLFYGKQLKDDVAGGARLTYASYRSKTQKNGPAADEREAQAEQLDLHLGVSIGKSNRTDLALTLGLLGSLKQKTATVANSTEHSLKRGLETALSVRNMATNDQGRRYVEGAIGLRSPKVKTEDGTAAESGTFDEKAVLVEGGYVATPAEGALIGGGIGLAYLNSKGPLIQDNTGVGSTGRAIAIPSILSNGESVKKTTTWLYAILSVEAPVTEHIGLMGGLLYTLWGTIKTDDKVTTAETESEETIGQTPDSSLWALGAFYRFEKLRIDVSYSKGFLHKGPYFVTGDETENLFGRLSVTYEL